MTATDIFTIYSDILKYRPGQARGKDGRWVSEGGSEGAGASSANVINSAHVRALTSDLLDALHSSDRTLFPKLFDSLKRSKKDVVVAVSRLFTPGSKEKLSRARALDRIWNRWQRLEDFRSHNYRFRTGRVF